MSADFALVLSGGLCLVGLELVAGGADIAVFR